MLLPIDGKLTFSVACLAPEEWETDQTEKAAFVTNQTGGPKTPAAAGPETGSRCLVRSYQRMPSMIGISLVSALMLTGDRPLADLLLMAGESTSR